MGEVTVVTTVAVIVRLKLYTHLLAGLVSRDMSPSVAHLGVLHVRLYAGRTSQRRTVEIFMQTQEQDACPLARSLCRRVCLVVGVFGFCARELH